MRLVDEKVWLGVKFDFGESCTMHAAPILVLSCLIKHEYNSLKPDPSFLMIMNLVITGTVKQG